MDSFKFDIVVKSHMHHDKTLLDGFTTQTSLLRIFGRELNQILML